MIDQREFIRLEVSDDSETLIVDLGIDSPPEEPIDITDLGPTLSPRDLAARKTLALFGRAEGRDFADVYDLARRYGRDQLLTLAAADDAGFDRHTFASMIASIDRLTDEDLPVSPRDVNDLRAYFQDWATELTEDQPLNRPGVSGGSGLAGGSLGHLACLCHTFRGTLPVSVNTNRIAL